MKMETLDLHLFDEGGAAGMGAPATDAAMQGGNVETQEKAQGSQAKSSKSAKAANPLANVRYGRQKAEPSVLEAGTDRQEADSNAQTQTRVSTDTLQERKAAFDELIKGEYKNEFGQRVQQIIDTRFKESKAMGAKLEALRPILDVLGSRYGVDAEAEPDKLLKAIDEDDGYYEAEANEKGLTVDQLKQWRRMERENAALRRAQEARTQQEASERIYAGWEEEAQRLKQVYPAFDLRQECQSGETGERFLKLLGSGVDVRTAYEVIHMNELMNGAIGTAVQLTQKRVQDNIRTQGMRPRENGAGGSIATQLVKSDPSKWSKADREEVARRVMRGERIEL